MVGRVAFCAVLGLVLGPMLAGLTRSVLDRAAPRETGWWRGRPASRPRVAGVTVAAGAVLALLATRIGDPAALVAFCWLGAAGVVLAVVDVDCHRLPDRVVGPASVVGVVALLAAGDLSAWLRALLAAAVVFTGFLVLALVHPAGLGFGDVKLAGLLGLHLGWLGWAPAVAGVVAGFGLGALVAIPLVLTRRVGLRTALPFGPALLAGALLAVLAGPTVLAAYPIP